MSIEEIKRYRTSDGKEFTDHTEAESHEKALDRLAARAKLPWLDRREYDLNYRLKSLLHEAGGCRVEMFDAVAEVSRILDWPIDVLKGNEATVRDLAHSSTRLAELLKEINKTESLLDRFKTGRERIAAASKDKDGTCQVYVQGDQMCGAPTVEGTCWCEQHIDQWCEQHGNHVIRIAYTSIQCCAQCLNPFEEVEY